METQFLKVNEVAAILNVGRTRAYELVASGQIPSVRLGGIRSVRVPKALLDKWIAEQCRAAEHGLPPERT